jgi:ABC-type transport system involved in multi-copper enzyme maturation permease subunit
MIDAVFWRLIWKEYRLQRAFFAAIVALAVLVQLAGLLGAAYRGTPLPVDWVYLIAAGAVALYALGCGATLFATEHESGTFDFQRALPLTATRLFLGKISFALASIVMLSLFVWLLTVLISRGSMPPWERQAEILCAGAVAALEMLAWGVFFSLLLRQPLLAAILGIAVASVIVQILVPSYTGYQYESFGFGHYLELLPQRLVFALTLLSLDALLGLRWLQGVHGLTRPAPSPDVAVTSRTEVRSTTAENWRAFGGLVWQTWQQGKRVLLTGVVIYLCLVMLPWLRMTYQDVSHAVLNARARPDGSAALIWLVFLATVFGCCAFLLDKPRHRFRFLAERGVKPRLVWASRHFLWGGVLLLIAALASIYLGVFTAFGSRVPQILDAPNEVSIILGWLCMIALTYAAGQACAMFVRSTVLAITFAGVASAALCSLTLLLAILRVPLAWSMAPVPLILLGATWLRAPDWLLERTSLRARVQAFASIVIPLGIITSAVIAYRINEIPKFDPGFSLEAFLQPPTDREQKARAEYATAYRGISPFGWPKSGERESMEAVSQSLDFTNPARPLLPEERQWVVANEDALGELLRATRAKSAAFFDPHTGQHSLSPNESRTVFRLLLAAAKYHQTQGDLEAAWQHYLAILRMTRHARHRGESFEHHVADDFEQMTLEHTVHWAALPQLSSDLLRDAIRDLQVHSANVPSGKSAVKNEHVLVRAYLLADVEAGSRLAVEPEAVRTHRLLLSLAPWERARALRVLNMITTTSLELLGRAKVTLDKGDVPEGFTYQDWLESPQVAYVETTPLASGLFWHGSTIHRIEAEFMQTTMRRAALLQLASEAFHRDHNQWPPRLEDLRGEYLTSIPPDPYTGQMFRYFPQGRNEITRWGIGSEWKLPGGETRVREVAPGQPFLWSAGPVMRRLYYVSADGKRSYLIEDSHGNQFQAVSEAEALARGWAFPLSTTSSDKPQS